MVKTPYIKKAIILIALATLVSVTLQQALAHFAPDFSSFYWASKVAFEQHLSPYQLDLLKKYGGDYTFPFIYPPTGLLTFYPWHFFEFKTAQLANYFINLMALIVSIYLLTDKIFKLRKSHSWATVSFVLGAFFMQPTTMSLANGQINLLILFLIVLSWHAMRIQHEKWAGFLIGLATGIKVYPALFILLFAIAGRLKSARSACITLGLFAILSFWILDGAIIDGWFQDVLLKFSGKNQLPSLPLSFLGNTSIHGYLQKLEAIYGKGGRFSFLPWTLIGYLLAILITTITGWLVWRTKKITSYNEHINNLYVLGTLTLLLAAPLTWDHHLCLSIAPLFWLGTRLTTNNATNYLRVISLLCVVIISWHIEYWVPVRPLNLLGIYSIKFYALLALWIICAYLTPMRTQTFYPN